MASVLEDLVLLSEAYDRQIQSMTLEEISFLHRCHILTVQLHYVKHRERFEAAGFDKIEVVSLDYDTPIIVMGLHNDVFESNERMEYSRRLASLLTCLNIPLCTFAMTSFDITSIADYMFMHSPSSKDKSIKWMVHYIDVNFHQVIHMYLYSKIIIQFGKTFSDDLLKMYARIRFTQRNEDKLITKISLSSRQYETCLHQYLKCLTENIPMEYKTFIIF